MATHSEIWPEIWPEIWIDRSGSLTRVARVEGRQLVALEVDNAFCMPRAGAVFVAKVVRALPALNAVEVDIGQNRRAFMPGRGLGAGALVQVKWVAPEQGGKLAVVKRLPGDTTGAPRLLQDGPEALTRIGAEGLPLREDDFDLIDLNAQIEALTARTVPLGRTGSLVFDRTEAAHVVDVNGTGRDLNRLALAETARQLRLRNLGGAILIDLAGDGRKLPKGLTDVMRAAVQGDPCRVEVYGITRLGLMELTRERRGWELSRLLQTPGGT